MSDEHCEHCTHTESLEKDVRALFTRTNRLGVKVALHAQAMGYVKLGIEDVKKTLKNQDSVLEKMKLQQQKWLGAIAVIVAIPGLYLMFREIFAAHPKP